MGAAINMQVSLNCLAIVSCGLAAGYPALVLPAIKHRGHNVSAQQVSSVGVAYYVVVLVGLLSAEPLMNKWGRRTCWLIAIVTNITGWIIIWTNDSIVFLACGMIILASGLSLSTPCAHVYLRESVPEELRCLVSPIIATSFSFGITGAYGLGYFYRDNWTKIAMVCSFIPSAAFILALFSLKETKVWIQRDQTEKNDLKSLFKEFKTVLSTRADVNKLFLTVNGVIILRQLSGMVVLTTFAIDFVEDFTPRADGYAVALVLGLIMTAGSPLGAALSMCVGSRKTLVYSCSLASFSILILTKLHRISGLPSDQWPTFTAESLLVCFVISNTVFLGVTDTFCEETYPAEVRKFSGLMRTYTASIGTGFAVVTYPLLRHDNTMVIIVTASSLCSILSISTMADDFQKIATNSVEAAINKDGTQTLETGRGLSENESTRMCVDAGGDIPLEKL